MNEIQHQQNVINERKGACDMGLYRDRRTQEVFADVGSAAGFFCRERDGDCTQEGGCPLDGKLPSCRDWAAANQEEAARLMALEVVEDGHVVEVAKMADEPEIPRICKVLGVEPGVRFQVSGNYGCLCAEAYVDDAGMVRQGSGRTLPCEYLCGLVSGELRAVPYPQWTPRDIEDARAALRILNTPWAARDEDGKLWGFAAKPLLDDGRWRGAGCRELSPDALPGLLSGVSVSLERVCAAGASYD